MSNAFFQGGGNFSKGDEAPLVMGLLSICQLDLHSKLFICLWIFELDYIWVLQPQLCVALRQPERESNWRSTLGIKAIEILHSTRCTLLLLLRIQREVYMWRNHVAKLLTHFKLKATLQWWISANNTLRAICSCHNDALPWATKERVNRRFSA